MKHIVTNILTANIQEMLHLVIILSYQVASTKKCSRAATLYC